MWRNITCAGQTVVGVQIQTAWSFSILGLHVTSVPVAMKLVGAAWNIALLDSGFDAITGTVAITTSPASFLYLENVTVIGTTVGGM